MTNHNVEQSTIGSISPQANEHLQKKILRDRAQQLSAEQEQTETEEQITVLAFQIANEKYSIESNYISSVLMLNELTILPGTPPCLIGVINVHGDIIPVFDIKKIFDIKLRSKDGKERSEQVVVVTVEDAVYGIVVDDLLGVVSIPYNKIQDSLPTLTGLRAEFLKGITNDQMIILDPIKFTVDKTLVGTIT